MLSKEVMKAVDKLDKGVYILYFIKKSTGLKREMLATRDPKMTPPITEYLKADEERITVFDLDKDEWRCFKPENFIGLVKI